MQVFQHRVLSSATDHRNSGGHCNHLSEDHPGKQENGIPQYQRIPAASENIDKIIVDDDKIYDKVSKFILDSKIVIEKIEYPYVVGK